MELCGRQKVVQRKMVLLSVYHPSCDLCLLQNLTRSQRRRCLWEDVSAERVYKRVSCSAYPLHIRPAN